jgi:hypothetical protein
MKSSFPVMCGACREWFPVNFTGIAVPESTQCPKCNSPIYLVPPLGNVVAMAILGRAQTELQNEDWTLTIVLGAMSVECELVYLFMKWSRVDHEFVSHRMPTDAEDEAFEKQWRDDFRTIAAKIDKVSGLLIGQSFDSFLSENSGLLQEVRAKYPTFDTTKSLKNLFIEGLFHKQNKVVHSGQIDFQKTDAEMCFTLAVTLYRILIAMDRQRISTFDAQLSAKRKP